MARYDVSVKIGNVIYVVLYTPLNGSNTVEYSPGIEMLFSVGNDKLTFNSRISGAPRFPSCAERFFRPKRDRSVQGAQPVLRHEAATSFDSLGPY